MTELSKEILERFQVRKTKAQKTAFIEFMQQKLPGLQVEAGGFPKNRNLVLGDLSKAKLLLTAHYDTCPKTLFPNFITPKNILVYILYNILIIVPFLAIMLLVNWGMRQLTQSYTLSVWVAYMAMMLAMFLVLMGGPANKHTANDNTSGVITLCEIYARLTPEQREKVCFIFFDNEEKGLMGSSFYVSKHKKDGLKEKLVLNFDCVSDGDHFLFVINKPARRQYGEVLEQVFQVNDGKNVEFCPSSRAIYPSDQSNFPVNAAVASLNRHKLVGLYMDKIHTDKDRVFDERNIELLAKGAVTLAESI